MIRKPLPKLALLTGSTLVGLLLIEVASRFVAPIFPGFRRFDMEDRPLTTTERDELTHIPGLVYRQVSSEYDARVTISELGYRVPSPESNPEVIFIGDSFTFGTGLRDEETFAHIFCATSRLSCANLGRVGTGTHHQVDILDHALEAHGWRPRLVKLFMFAMTGSLMGGNDLRDNLDYEVRGRREPVDRGETALERQVKSIMKADEVVLRHSNLARWLKFAFGPTLKSLLWPRAGERELAASLGATRRALERLDALSERYGFAYEIYLLHPVADLLRGTQTETAEGLRPILPDPKLDLISTAPLYARDPEAFYYSIDGHLNAAGSRELADWLLERARLETRLEQRRDDGQEPLVLLDEVDEDRRVERHRTRAESVLLVPVD